MSPKSPGVCSPLTNETSEVNNPGASILNLSTSSMSELVHDVLLNDTQDLNISLSVFDQSLEVNKIDTGIVATNQEPGEVVSTNSSALQSGNSFPLNVNDVSITIHDTSAQNFSSQISTVSSEIPSSIAKDTALLNDTQDFNISLSTFDQSLEIDTGIVATNQQPGEVMFTDPTSNSSALRSGNSFPLDVNDVSITIQETSAQNSSLQTSTVSSEILPSVAKETELNILSLSSNGCETTIPPVATASIRPPDITESARSATLSNPESYAVEGLPAMEENGSARRGRKRKRDQLKSKRRLGLSYKSPRSGAMIKER